MNRQALISFLKWFSTGLALFGAVLNVANIYPLNIVFMNLGGFGWLIVGLMVRDRALVTINAGFLVIYGIGAVLLYLN